MRKKNFNRHAAACRRMGALLWGLTTRRCSRASSKFPPRVEASIFPPGQLACELMIAQHPVRANFTASTSNLQVRQQRRKVKHRNFVIVGQIVEVEKLEHHEILPTREEILPAEQSNALMNPRNQLSPRNGHLDIRARNRTAIDQRAIHTVQATVWRNQSFRSVILLLTSRMYAGNLDLDAGLVRSIQGPLL